MRQYGRIERWLRGLVCQVRDHKWRGITSYHVAHVRKGHYCTRCQFAQARDFHGQYPVPR